MNEELTQAILEAVAAGESADDLVARYPDHSASIKALIQTIQALQTVQHPPVAERASQAQAEFMRQVGQRRVAANARRVQPARRWRLPRRLALALGMLVLLFGSSGGALVASAHALPGDPLYGLKRWREQLEFNLSSADQRINHQLNHSAERQREIEELLDTAKPVPATALLDLHAQTSAAELALEGVATSDPRWQTLVGLIDRQEQVLALVPAHDSATRQALEQTRLKMQQTRQRTRLVVEPQVVTPPATPPRPTMIPTPTLIPTAPPVTVVAPTAPSPKPEKSTGPAAKPEQAKPTAKPDKPNLPVKPKPKPPVAQPKPKPPAAQPKPKPAPPPNKGKKR